MIFGETTILSTLLRAWSTNDFMFCHFDCPRGTSLDNIRNDANPLSKPLSPFMVQKRIRELLTIDDFMSPAEAAITTRHSNRHFASNVVRATPDTAWPMDLAKKVSYWGSIKEMPTRDSQAVSDKHLNMPKDYDA